MTHSHKKKKIPLYRKLSDSSISLNTMPLKRKPKMVCRQECGSQNLFFFFSMSNWTNLLKWIQLFVAIEEELLVMVLVHSVVHLSIHLSIVVLLKKWVKLSKQHNQIARYISKWSAEVFCVFLLHNSLYTPVLT